MNYPKDLENLIEFYKKLPGIGEKTAERLSFATIEFSQEEVSEFVSCLTKAKNNLKRCNICGNLTENEICKICEDDSRFKNIICVVEDFKSIFSFEKTRKFKGNYHVLNGLISPIDNIGPEEINIEILVQKVRKLENVEIILALKPTIEGETTILYLKRILANDNVTISRLAYGIPIGADFEYLDNITLEKALEDRKRISE